MCPDLKITQLFFEYLLECIYCVRLKKKIDKEPQIYSVSELTCTS